MVLFLVSVSLPSAAVAIASLTFRLVATVGANKNPKFASGELHPIQRGFFFFTLVT